MKPAAVDHPKMLRLARLLGEPHLMTVGRMECFWTWVARYAEEGDLSKSDEHEIATAVRWDGDSMKIVSALESVGFLDRTESGLIVHDWEEHRPAYVRSRLRMREKDHLVSRNGGGDFKPSATLRSATLRSADSPAEKKPVEHGFAEAWAAYPRSHNTRSSRSQSLEVWRKLGLAAHAENVLAWIAFAKTTRDWTKADEAGVVGGYIPGMQVWLKKPDFSEPPPGAQSTAAQQRDSGPCVNDCQGPCGHAFAEHQPSRQRGLSCTKCACGWYTPAATLVSAR